MCQNQIVYLNHLGWRAVGVEISKGGNMAVGGYHRPAYHWGSSFQKQSKLVSDHWGSFSGPKHLGETVPWLSVPAVTLHATYRCPALFQRCPVLPPFPPPALTSLQAPPSRRNAFVVDLLLSIFSCPSSFLPALDYFRHIPGRLDILLPTCWFLVTWYESPSHPQLAEG